MGNPLYRKNMGLLLDAAATLDVIMAEVSVSELRLSVEQLYGIIEQLGVLLPRVDTLALPRKVHPAARALGDALWLLGEEMRAVLADEETLTESAAPLPTVNEVHKYADEPEPDNRITLDLETHQAVTHYYYKAKELLRAPAQSYGLL